MVSNNLQIYNYTKYNNAHNILENCLRLATDYEYMVSDYVIDALGTAIEELEEKLSELDTGDKNEK